MAVDTVQAAALRPAAAAQNRPQASMWDRLEAARVGRMKPGGFDLATLNHIAVDDEHIVNVLDQLGFDETHDELDRGTAEWWPDSFGPILIASGAEVGFVAVDLGSGAWRVLPPTGARGLDLIDLAERRLALPRWKAAVALARICALSHVPEVPAR